MRSKSTHLSRRDFVGQFGALVAATVLPASVISAQPAEQDASRLHSRPGQPREAATPGAHQLHLGGQRDGLYMIPANYAPSKPAPLLVLMHGATQSASMWSQPRFQDVLSKRNVVLLCPDSRDHTWDLSIGGFGPDVQFIDKALALVFSHCAIDPTRVALAGFSDGASYSLSLGIANGDLFPNLMAFSPGFFEPGPPIGKPKIFVSHGTNDQILPIDRASRRIVPQLKQSGYDVKYVEFTGPHTVNATIMDSALDWWLGTT